MRKLTEDQAWEIYQLAWYTELPHAEIAASYGIKPAAVSNIKHGYSWGFEPDWIGLIVGGTHGTA